MDKQLIRKIQKSWEPSSGKAGILVQRFDGFSITASLYQRLQPYPGAPKRQAIPTAEENWSSTTWAQSLEMPFMSRICRKRKYCRT
jgi:hypothetical protein